MKVKILLNGTMREAEISSDQLLIDFVRDHGCYSVKRGCETSNCGLSVSYTHLDVYKRQNQERTYEKLLDVVYFPTDTGTWQ